VQQAVGLRARGGPVADEHCRAHAPGVQEIAEIGYVLHEKDSRVVVVKKKAPQVELGSACGAGKAAMSLALTYSTPLAEPVQRARCTSATVRVAAHKPRLDFSRNMLIIKRNSCR
jgi:hypothetical protein